MSTWENSVFFPGLSIFYIWNDPLDRGWDPIVPRWSWLYNIRTPANQRSAGRWGGSGIFFHTVRRGINAGDIPVFVLGLSELYMCGRIMIMGMEPIVSRWRLFYVRSPANERPAIRRKGHTRYSMFFFRLKLDWAWKKFFVQCYRVLVIFHLPHESGLQQQIAALLQ